MTIAEQYAKALYALNEPSADTLQQLRKALARRGHIQLLPRIFDAYKKLQLHDERLTQHKKITPEDERTRILLELYKKLIA
jgi:F0F1-type ATP synthase delta subunit